jgi:hypothetical protein
MQYSYLLKTVLVTDMYFVFRPFRARSLALSQHRNIYYRDQSALHKRSQFSFRCAILRAQVQNSAQRKLNCVFYFRIWIPSTNTFALN